MDERITTGREKFIRSLPGESLIAYSFGEGLIAVTKTDIDNPTVPPETRIVLWAIVGIGIAITFLVRIAAGIPGDRPLKWKWSVMKENKIGRYLKLILYASLVSVQAFLYAITLFRSIIIPIEWQLQVPYLFGAAGFGLAIAITLLFKHDKGFLEAVARYNAACGVAKLNDNINATEHLKKAQEKCVTYITKEKLEDEDDFEDIRNDDPFKSFYENDVKI